jgi:hypothetical protein
MKTLPGKCKICGKALELKVDDSYPGDALNLVPMACCNWCFDMRERRIKIETMLKKVCYQLNLEKVEGAKKLDPKSKAILEDSIKCYAGQFSRWCSDWLHRQHTANVGYLVSAILEEPSRWYYHLCDFENAANQR